MSLMYTYMYFPCAMNVLIKLFVSDGQVKPSGVFHLILKVRKIAVVLYITLEFKIH